MSTDPGTTLRSETRRDGIDVERIRGDFPALHQQVYDKPLVYLDNAATTQKPRPVIEALRRFYEEDCSNVHRGVHRLSQRATDAYEGAREKISRFVNAADPGEIVFVRGTTEAVNLVAQTFGQAHIGRGDEVLITAMEHHSNIVPWQMLCQQTGARLSVAPIDDRGELIFEEFERRLNARTRLVSLVHASNALGTVNPVKRVVRAAHRHEVPVLIDGAQAAPHIEIDVQDLGCDFYTLSGHKMYGPTGIGVLYGRAELLDAMPPYQGGGEMIRSVTFAETTYNVPPHRFEAGTPNIAGAIGLGAAVDYVSGLGLDAIEAHERDLLAYATEALSELDGVRLIGTARDKTAIASFVLEGVHPHDVGTILDREGVAVRTGHHCAQPVMDRFEVPATTRASMGVYNTRAEIDALIAGLDKVFAVFG